MTKLEKYLKDMVTNKTKLGYIKKLALIEEYSSVVMSKLLKKLRDPGIFTSLYKLVKVIWFIL